MMCKKSFYLILLTLFFASCGHAAVKKGKGDTVTLRSSSKESKDSLDEVDSLLIEKVILK